MLLVGALGKRCRIGKVDCAFKALSVFGRCVDFYVKTIVTERCSQHSVQFAYNVSQRLRAPLQHHAGLAHPNKCDDDFACMSGEVVIFVSAKSSPQV
eukprot:6480281-Amphidinium_carterae.1